MNLIPLLSFLHNIESWIWSFHWGALLSLGQHISWTAPHALFDQTPCNHASFEPDPLLYTSWCGIPFWDGRILQNNKYFWRKPGLVWIEKYRLVEFVGNPLKYLQSHVVRPRIEPTWKQNSHLCILNLSFFTQYNERVSILNLDKNDKKYDFWTK